MADKNIWDYLLKQLGNEYGVAGLMGNIYAESGMRANRVEMLCLKRLSQNGQNYNDTTYTAAIDSGRISRATFLNPLPGKQYGYGLCQWTSPSRKAGLYDLVKSKGVSISDENTQLEWLMKELTTTYPTVLKTLKNAKSIQEASDIVLTRFECPANIGSSVKTARANYGKQYYNKYAGGKVTNMGNYDNYIYSKGTHYISNSGHDENGQYHGGAAGDQTGDEWYLRSWYNRPWNCVIRYTKNSQVGLKLAELGCAAALNDNIGYDQYGRDSYWNNLRLVGYDPSKITKKCESDCSAGVIANTRAVGYLLGIPALQTISATYTGDMRAAYSRAGFTILTDSKYTSGYEYLLPGDILLNERSHTATNVTKGAYVNFNPGTSATTGGNKVPQGNKSYCGKGIGTATALCEMNIRAGNGTSYTSYGSITAGTAVEVLEKTSNNWYKIVWPGAAKGYAYTSCEKNSYYKYVANKKQQTTTATTNIKKVTAKQGADSFNKNLAGTYVVSTNGGTLNVRDGAGTKKSVLVTIPKGTKVKNYGYYNVSNGDIWLYIQFTYKNVIYTGFASKDYLRKE